MNTQCSEKTATPALEQTGSTTNSENTWRDISKWDSFDYKQHIISQVLRLALAVMSLFEQHVIAFTAS